MKMVKTKREGRNRKVSNKQTNHTSHNQTASSSIQKSQRLLLTPPKCRRQSNKFLEKRKVLKHLARKQNMPSLLDLEKMFEESEGEVVGENIQVTSVDINTHSSSNGVPEQNNSYSYIAPISPTTAQKYADDVLNILDSYKAPLPIIPMKKYQKSDVPYIVNCTEHPRIPENKNCNVFDSGNYGISTRPAFSVDDDNNGNFNCCGLQFSKSIFNAQANEVASKLLLQSNSPIHKSDSDDTVVYELNTPVDRFSPKPSTSNDSAIIPGYDQSFNEYCTKKYKVREDNLLISDISMDFIDNKQVKSMPQCITQVNSDFDNNDIQIIEKPCEMIVVDDDDDDDCEITGGNIRNIIKCGKVTKKNANIAPIVVENYPNSCDPQIIDEIDLTNVEDLIAENQSLIKKYSKNNTLNTVNIEVADVVKSSQGNQNNAPQTSNSSQPNSLDINNSPDNLEKVMTELFSNFLWQPTNSTQKTNLSNQDPKISVNYDDNVPHNLNSKPTHLNNLGTCPICLEYICKDKVGSTNCGHLFCMSCIIAALKTKPKRCPSCRKKLTGKGYHQIYL